MKEVLAGVLCLFIIGCASAPWNRGLENDYRLEELNKCEESLNLKLAVAPVILPLLVETEESEISDSERQKIPGDPDLIREEIIEALKYTGIFSVVAPLNLPQAECKLEDALEAAWELDYDVILSTNVKSMEVFYDGVNGWYIPNLLNWLFLLVPSWWVKDEVYGATITFDIELRSARSGNQLYKKDFISQSKYLF